MLRRALDKLLDRAAAGTEVIVVDSGSKTTETARVADREGVVFVRSDVPGLSIARNAGLGVATRAVVAYTDDDCAVEPGFVEALGAAFRDQAVGAATGYLRDHTADPGADVRRPATLTTTVQGLDAGHGALMAFRRGPLSSLGGFDSLLGAGRRFGGAEDLDAFARILHAGWSIARVPDAVVVHENTRDDDDYADLNAAYGRGLGAMCAKWRRIDATAARALAGVVARRAAVRSVRRCAATRTRRADSAYVGGLLTGFREGRSIPVVDGLFVDREPDAPVIARSVLTVEEPA